MVAHGVAPSRLLKDVGVLLAIAQLHRYLVGTNLGKGAPEEQRPTHVGQPLLEIRIEVNHVAHAEVGQEVLTLVGHA